MKVSDILRLMHVERDCLRFLIHDLQHAERFFDPQLYFEQVGFFHCMYQSMYSSPGQTVLQHYSKDTQLTHDLDHCAADMNTSAIHSFGFVKAKMINAEYRRLYTGREEECPRLTEHDKQSLAERVLKPMMSCWNMTPEVEQVWTTIKQGKIEENQVTLVAEFFRKKGADLLQLDWKETRMVPKWVKRVQE
jgi:hypothetical protein